jgi:AcrR family transcriptional regulator
VSRTRATGYDQQRQTILAHAAHLFARHGYSAASMNQVAEACGLSKAALYYYYRSKYTLLLSIAEGHVSRLQAVVDEVSLEKHPPERELRELIRRFLGEYADAQYAHRVLTEDVRFLKPADRERVLGREREVVAGFARAVGRIRPELRRAALAKPLTMLLFGMINWMFTWMDPEGPLDYDAMSPVVADLFLGGLAAVKSAAFAGLTDGVTQSIGEHR